MPENLGTDILDLWKEYEVGATIESQYVNALDKLEAQLHVCSVGEHRLLKSYSLTPVYADKAVLRLNIFKDMLQSIKITMRAQFENEGLEWKKDYNLFM
ncbi:Uncharacterised protein [Candidatus Tiddalikarchaeum anstoanum]|nr:Uncharacterised protein [Candidatus Tiddalikarchaeum anstoanum]